MTGPAYDAADVAAVLFVSCTVMFLLCIVAAVGSYVAHGGSIGDDLDGDVEVCEDCSLILTERTRAVTCPVHRLCVDCDAHRVDSCGSCRAVRIEVAL